MKITGLRVESSTLSIHLEDGSVVNLQDDGQSCCERRYMTCDDDLQYYIGADYYGWEVRNSNEGGDSDYDVHEVQFLLVNTSRGTFTTANHNIHNGYYGGFWIQEHIRHNPLLTHEE